MLARTITVVLTLALAAPGWVAAGDLGVGSSGVFPEVRSRSALAERLAAHPRALKLAADRGLVAVFGLPPPEARSVFFPVSQARALPTGYMPTDLVYVRGHLLRNLIVAELAAMLSAAAGDGAYPAVISGYRSAAYQASLFERAVQRQLAREDSIDRQEAERRAARFVARPGHSQHQLGTAADFSSGELGYGIGRGFGETLAGRWLSERAWEFGFILPYTTAAEERTSYVAEPWHLRWVGRPLAAFLWEQDYLHSPYPTADDWLEALEELLETVPAAS